MRYYFPGNNRVNPKWIKSNTNSLDILTKYIFSSVTSLFSEDISENFIILATFANKDTIKKGTLQY